MDPPEITSTLIITPFSICGNNFAKFPELLPGSTIKSGVVKYPEPPLATNAVSIFPLDITNFIIAPVPLLTVSFGDLIKFKTSVPYC